MNLSVPGRRCGSSILLAELRLQRLVMREQIEAPATQIFEQESPARESGAFDLGWNGDDYTGHLALAAVSAATVTSTAAVSTAGMPAAKVSATV